MSTRRPLDYRVRCVTNSKEPPCESYQQSTFPPNGPTGVLPFNAYAGPATVADPPGPTTLTFPNTLTPFDWFALSNSTQSTFLPEANTSTTSLTTGGFGTGTEYVETLPAGTYKIGFSLTLFPGENDTGIVAAIGTHTNANPQPTGTPIPHPLITAGNGRPAISSTANGATTSSIVNLSAEGGITLTSPLTNVGIIFQPLENKAFQISDVQLTILRLE